jgi:regulatory protein
MRDAELEEKELKKAKNYAYRFLSFRPRSSHEVEQKLTEKGFAENVIRSAMADLGRLGYVNDREFAGQWARSRVRLRGFGRRRIDQELRDKGISREIARETLADLFQDSAETDLALREAEKKLKTLSRFEPEVRRRRLAGFLERRGFPAEIIRTVLQLIRSSTPC